MTTFDGWEAQLYGPDTLAHFRTKGSKNGVRRYQNEDGTWTPLGLRERKAREGWGSERKARRAEKKAARAERKAASAAARNERMAAYKEEKRKNNPKTMTDEELRKSIARVKMEMEYRELTKSPVLKVGEKLVSGYMNYRVKKEEHQQAKEKNAMDLARMRSDLAKSKELTKQREFEAKRAESEAENSASQAEKAKITRKRDIINSKIAYKSTTIRGGIAKMLNKSFTGLGDAAATLHKGRAERQVANAKAKSERTAFTKKAAAELKADTNRWNAEAKKGANFVNELFRTRERVDKYNRKRDPWQPAMNYDPDEWNRKKNK